MNNTGISTSVYANVVAPFSPVGKQAVGLENAEAREEVFPPVEESAATDAAPRRGNEVSDSEQLQQQREVEQRAEERQQQQQQLQDQQIIRELAARDREVRAHEQAHAAVGGQYAGAPSYTFERGPDGINYAVGGEVPISFPSGGGDPRQVLAAAEQIRRAALAPADPSAQDRRVAAQAVQLAAEARADIAEQQRLESQQAEQARQDDRQQEQVEQQEAGEQQPVEPPQNARRGAQLGEQLTALDSVQNGAAVGSVIDQRA